tara:strand:- start:9 stop:1688 length:1680 start_codon:yes stop_codon:yes gene_type:complete
MKLPVGIDDFSKIINNDYDLVDKSLFIKDIIEDGAEVILITRPRRFGKTINMSMLECFFGSQNKQEKNLFYNLEISKYTDLCTKHQNKYPVIFITFKSIYDNNYQDAEKSVLALIASIYSKFKELVWDVLEQEEQDYYQNILSLQAGVVEIKYSLSKLSYFLYKKTKVKSIILIDEYDAAIHSGYIHGYYDEITNLIRGVFGEALKGNQYLEKAVLTGITVIASESLFSGLNHFKGYGVLQTKYSACFGFTEGETIDFCSKAKLSLNMQEIKKWYNGYLFGSNIIYNPWSIINCLNNNGELDAYWVNTSQNLLLKRLLGQSGTELKASFEQLLQNNSVAQPIEDNLIFPDLDRSNAAVWTLLLNTGYLRVDSTLKRRGRVIANLAIPNEEIKIIYEKIFENWFECSSKLSITHYEYFINSLKNNKLDIFEKILQDYISESGSYFDFNKNTKEQVFHSFFLGLVVGLREDYIIQSNQEAGFGRFDLAFIPKNKTMAGIILEFKTTGQSNELEKFANEAINQAVDKKYALAFKQHGIKDVCLIGVAFCGKELKLLSKNINL